MKNEKFNIIIAIVVSVSIVMFISLYMFGKINHTTAPKNIDNGITNTTQTYQPQDEQTEEYIDDTYFDVLENEEDGFNNSQEQDLDIINNYYSSLDEEQLEGNSIK